jgi:hypothetical protein
VEHGDSSQRGAAIVAFAVRFDNDKAPDAAARWPPKSGADHGVASSVDLFFFDRSVAVTGDNLYGIVARRLVTSGVSNTP